MDVQFRLLGFLEKYDNALGTGAQSELEFQNIFQAIKTASETTETLRGQTQDVFLQNTADKFFSQLREVQFRLLQLRLKNTFPDEQEEQSPEGLPSLPPLSADTEAADTIAAPEQEGGGEPAGQQVQEQQEEAPAQATEEPWTEASYEQTPDITEPPVTKVIVVKRPGRWRRFGLGSFFCSLTVHAILLLIALFWVVSTHFLPGKEPPLTFSTGAGGGDEGKTVKTFKHKRPVKSVRDLLKTSPRLAVKTPSPVSLPEVPPLLLNLSQIQTPAGDLSKGMGGGFGGGFGAGIGVGNGGRGFISKMVMGVQVKAEKIAVYLDNSGSMVPFLEDVKKEIYTQYPDADIFEYNGILIHVIDNMVTYGRTFTPNGAAVRARITARARTSSSTKVKPKMGKSIIKRKTEENMKKKLLEKYGDNFNRGSVGAWMDIVAFENYDALVVFSDFQDGVIHKNSANAVVYKETRRKTDNQPETLEAWEQEWVARFSDRDSAPKLYLFSIQVPPQSIWQKCVEVSEGEIKMMPELRLRQQQILMLP
ncbi:MAG: hypothetical protein LBV54_06165 [Puniceicoccales bacterium]|nr:hypothetical protein [Puniceicoccales bacterium]